MSETTIWLPEEAKARLTVLKREGESYEDVIMRLTGRDKWAGFGALAESDTETSDGMERIRAEMRDGLGDDIGDM